MPIFGGFVGDLLGGLFGDDGDSSANAANAALQQQITELTQQNSALNHQLQQSNQFGALGSGGVTPQPRTFGQFPSPTIPDLRTHDGSTLLFRDDIEALSTFATPEIFRSFLANARRPGGFLAPAQQTQEFAIQAGGAIDQLEGQRRDLRADLGNLNPAFARRAESNLEFDALGNVLNARVGASAAAAERNFLADQAFANALAATDVAQKQQTLQGLQFNVDLANQLKAAREGARASKQGALIGGGLSAIGQIGAALI